MHLSIFAENTDLLTLGGIASKDGYAASLEFLRDSS
jgi:hypothetical protein